jgi:hypothetical protein
VLRWIGTSDPPSGTIRQGFHIQTTHTYPEATSVAVVRGHSAHAAQILPFQLFRHHHHSGITSDPFSGTIRQGLSTSKLPHLSRDNHSVADVVPGPIHMQLSPTVPLFRHHHHVLRWDWHFRSTLWYHRQGFHIQTTTPIRRNQCRRRGSGATSAHAAQILTFQLFRHHHHVLRWIGTSRSTHWYHKTRLSFKLPTPVPRDATSVADVVQIIGTSAQILPIVPPPPPCAAVGLALQTTLWYHKTRNSHPNYPHLPQGRIQCRRRGSGATRAMQLKFYRSNCSATTTMCCGGIGPSDPPSGTIDNKNFHIQLPTSIPGTQPVLQRWFGATRHMQLKFYRSTVPHHHYVLRWDYQIHPSAP